MPRSGATPAFADPGGDCAIEQRARLLCRRRPRMVSFSLLPPIREQSRLVVSAAAEALALCVARATESQSAKCLRGLNCST
jgi:hypothetical protein